MSLISENFPTCDRRVQSNIQRKIAETHSDKEWKTVGPCIYQAKQLSEDIEAQKKVQGWKGRCAANPKKEKAVALAQLALAVTILAVGVGLTLAIAYLGPSTIGTDASLALGVCTPLLTFIVLAVLGGIYDHKWGARPYKGVLGQGGGDYGYPLYIPFAGPFVPLVQSLRGPKRYDKALEEYATKIPTNEQRLKTLANQEKLETLAEQFDENSPEHTYLTQLATYLCDNNDEETESD